MIGEPDAGKPHVRFDEGVQETCDNRGAPAPYSTVGPLGPHIDDAKDCHSCRLTGLAAKAQSLCCASCRNPPPGRLKP